MGLRQLRSQPPSAFFRLRILSTALAASSSFHGGAANAQDSSGADTSRPIEVVVSATRSPLEHVHREPTVASTVLSGDALHRAGQTASDVLAQVPGVQVARSGAPSDLATASIRGTDSSEVPIYLAGIRINDDLSGTADLSTVPIWMIERAEVFRGNAPESADRLGMGGAIFFWPRQPHTTRAGAGVQAGSFGERGGWVAYEAGSARASSLVAARRSQATNDYPFVNDGGRRFDLDEVRTRRENADFVAHDAWAIGRFEPLRGARVSLVAHAFEREQGLTGLSVVPAERARGTSRRLLGGVSVSLPCRAGADCRIEAQASLLAARSTTSDPLVELPSVRTRLLHDAGTRQTYTLRGTSSVSRHLELGTSAVQSFERIDISRLGNLPRDASRSSTRLAAFGSWRPSEDFDLHALAAAECHTTRALTENLNVPIRLSSGPCGTLAASARLGARLALSPALDLVANLARYARLPTLGELYGTSPLVQGNPALGSERGVSSDVGLHANLELPALAGQVSVDAFAFARFADDLIRFKRTGTSSVAPFNVASARILGAEAALGGQLFDLLELTATATILEPQETTRSAALDPTPNDVLPLTSRLVTSVRIEAFSEPGWSTLAQDRVGIAIAHLYRSSRYDDAAGLTVLPAQSFFDVEATTSHFGGRLLARFALRNLFDSRQLDLLGLPVPGRSLHAELEAWF